MPTRECMITVITNPYDYFKQFEKWNLWDVEQGYNTCSYLARITNMRDDMTQEEENAEVERAVDEILALNPLKIYKKVYRDSDKEITPQD